jgi:RsiW-degrading membrane proteinase PrsW (M82 family)
MMANWLTLVVVGLVIWAFTLAPVFPAGWRTFVQALAGILVAVGVLILVLGLLGVRV